MKRVLAANEASIYQICRSFRDDPATPIHRVEFTMLEFYRMGFTLEQLITGKLGPLPRVGRAVIAETGSRFGHRPF